MSIVRAQIAGGTQGVTRAYVVEALQEYAATYGPAFTTASFNPSVAKWRDRPELVDRYYAGRSDGSPWPSLNTIKGLFGGSFNAAREAAGLAANKPGPARREKGTHQPIRDVRIERVVVRTERDDVELGKRLDRALARAERAERKLAERPRVREKLIPAKPVIREKTITKTVKVRDERAVERLRLQMGDEKTRRVASEDQTKAAVRDRDTALRLAEDRALELARALAEAKNYDDENKRLRDRLEVAENRLAEVRNDLVEQAESEAKARADVTAAAAIADRVRVAERRADAAELRAARAEREMVEQAQAITGERRKLTAAEMVELRVNGPAGPKVMGDALSLLARARAGRGRLDEALTEIASAALTWKDRL
jgi:hypothetical protein